VYLGLPIGGDSGKLSFWKPLVDRITASSGDRLVLLKFVLSSLPVYFLSFFKAPTGIISSIESIFLKKNCGGCEVSKKIAWIKWEFVCLPVTNSGLGVQRLGVFNFYKRK